MSVSVSRSDGVTLLTLTSDPNSACPPLCQLLGALCYSPGFCAVKKHLVPERRGPLTVLGALWIITGLLHIGFGMIFLMTRGAPYYILKEYYCPVWLGILFVFFGLSCILSERSPRPVLTLLNALLNLAGLGFSITAIVWYGGALDNVGFYELCWSEDYDYWNYPRVTLAPDDKALLRRCQEARLLMRTLSISISIVLVTLSSVDVCLALSSVFFSCRTLVRGAGRSGYSPLPQEDKVDVQEAKRDTVDVQEANRDKVDVQEANQDKINVQEPSQDKVEVQEPKEGEFTVQEPKEDEPRTQELQRSEATVQEHQEDNIPAQED